MDQTKRKALLLCEVADEHKARDIVLLDVSHLTPICDFFVLCTCENPIHIRSLVEAMQERVAMELDANFRPQGAPESNWVVLDGQDVVVHLFNDELRHYYDLETLWGDAKNVNWQKEAKSHAR